MPDTIEEGGVDLRETILPGPRFFAALPKNLTLAPRTKRTREFRTPPPSGLRRDARAAGFVNPDPFAIMRMIQSEVTLASEALNALSAHIAVLDARGVIIFVNAAWSRFASRNGGVCGADAYVGTDYLAVCRHAVQGGDADARAALDGIEGVLRGEREGFAFDYPCSSGEEERWFRMSVTRFAAGPEHCLVVSHEDITAERQGRRALEDAERLLRSVIEALPIGVWILDARGCIVQGNAAGLRIWAGARYVGPEQFGEYKGWWLSTGEPIAAEEWAAARAITKGETSIDEEIEIECFDGTHKIILNSAVPLFDSGQRIAGAIIVNQDITPRKRDEAERGRMLWEHERLRAAAQEANRMKDDFIATLSHELRTPLQSVLGWTTILKRTLGDRQATGRAADAIERNARLSVRLVNETLDLSRIARGTLRLEKSDVDFGALVGEVLDIIRPGASEKGVGLVAELEGVRAVVHGDPTRLQQIVWNLLTNALKFTPAGGRVDVRVHTAGGEVRLSVHDTGTGIAPEFLPFVFDRYRQGAGPRTGAQPGLGLGLSIVKELVAQHGGTITADSAGEGEGATFTLRLPLVPER